MPRLEALLLCDLIVQGPDQKVQLQGIFDTIFAPALPAQHASMWVYFRFYVGEVSPPEPKHRLMFVLRRPSGVSETLPELPCQDFGGKVEGNVRFQGLPLIESGEHWLELYCDAEKIGAYRLSVRAAGHEKTPTVVH
jgi:hypothetical protein